MHMFSKCRELRNVTPYLHIPSPDGAKRASCLLRLDGINYTIIKRIAEWRNFLWR